MADAREDAPERRGVLPWLLGALLAGGVLAWVILAAGGPEGAPVDVAAPAPAPPDPSPDPAFPAPGDAELPEPIRRYLEATPYPESSGRLTEAHEDLLAPNRRHERARPIPDTVGDDLSRVVSSLFTADRYFYTSDEVVQAFLQVTRGGEVLNVRLLGASLVREGRAGAVGSVVPLDFRWQGDRYVLEQPLSAVADHHGPVVLGVHYEYAPGAAYEESLRLFVTPADRVPARFTGEFDDDVVDGSLEVDVGLEVHAPGFYRFDANLYDLQGRPVAFATYKGELGAGSRELPLSFYGKVLRDAGAPGPWVLGELRGYRFLEGAYPDRERLPDYPERYTTGAHALAALTDEAHVSAHERHMVDLMLEDLARGLTLDVPPTP